MSDATTDPFDANRVRNSFEESFRNYFGRGKADALFDQPAEFWLSRTDEGQYEIARVNDAWTGFLAAARYYAHFESLLRAANLGHEQMFAECQRLSKELSAARAALLESRNAP